MLGSKGVKLVSIKVTGFIWFSHRKHKTDTIKNETHLSTIRHQKKTHPWVPCPHENTRRQGSYSCTPGKRASQTQRVIIADQLGYTQDCIL